MLDLLRGLFSNEIAIDLGTATTLIYRKNMGIVLTEPSVLAIRTDYRGTQSVCAVGTAAKRLLGRSPGAISAVRPVRDGVVADFKVTSAMLSNFIERSSDGPRTLRPWAVIAVPSGTTEVERRAVRDSAVLAGAREVRLIEEPMAAAIGAGVDVGRPVGSMVVDIGGGTTDIAIISSHGVVYSESTRVGGDEMDEAIIRAVEELHNLHIGVRTAEQIKLEIGCAHPTDEILSIAVKGQDLTESVPRTIEIKSEEIYRALLGPSQRIVERIRLALQSVPPEISADIGEEGILLVGGGALLQNLDVLIHQNTGLDVRIANNPQECVVLGAGRCLEERALLEKIRIPV
jgi:rod shape-determining protein MreB